MEVYVKTNASEQTVVFWRDMDGKERRSGRCPSKMLGRTERVSGEVFRADGYFSLHVVDVSTCFKSNCEVLVEE